MGSGYAWIVTEQALNASNVPKGVLGARLLGSSNERAHIEDSVTLIASSIRDLYYSQSNITNAPNVCDEKRWESGSKILRYVLQLL